ncbi:MAG: energy transducer TonB [Beijerinckiaceae bacterium]|nr:energy transducer TonB [Beijerinckiaceae bacterium]
MNAGATRVVMSCGYRWGVAFLAAAFLHVSVVALAIGGKAPTDLVSEDVGGLVIVDFAPTVATAESQEESATPSDEAATATPSPEVEQKKSAMAEDDTPPAESSPHEPPPDLQLSQQKTIEKQEAVEDAQPTEANEATVTPSPSASAAASASAAPPAIQENAATQAPTEGSTDKSADAPASWRRAVVAHMGKHKRYPAQARAQRNEGEVAVRFRIDRAGRVLSATVLRSSGFPALDAAALDLLQRAQPLPAFPPSMRAGEIELVAPVNFRLR